MTAVPCGGEILRRTEREDPRAQILPCPVLDSTILRRDIGSPRPSWSLFKLLQ